MEAAPRRWLTGFMKRLALVADHSYMVDTFRLVVRQTSGFKVVAIVDGRMPVRARIQEARPDVVLVDDMRDQRGTVDRIQEIRDELPDVMLVFLAAAMDPGHMGTAIEAGADAIISKSVHPAALATLLRETANGNVFHSAVTPRVQRADAAWTSLTARELEILQLVAAGGTNGEIARALWVTEKTVKFHLSNVYRKLGVSNRTSASHYVHTNDVFERRQRSAS